MKMDSYHFCLAIIFCLPAIVFADLKQDVDETTKCMESQNIQQDIFPNIIECYKKQLGIGTAFSIGNNYEDIITKACSIKDPKACILDNTEVLRDTCFTAPSLKKEFDKSMRQFDAIFQYVCNGGGQRILEFINSGGIACVSKLFTDADNKASTCLVTQSESKIKELEAGGDYEKYQEIQCSLLYLLKSCTIDHMTSCSQPRDLLVGLFHEFVKAFDCSKYAPASSGRIQVPYILMFLSSSLLMLLCHP